MAIVGGGGVGPVGGRRPAGSRWSWRRSPGRLARPMGQQDLRPARASTKVYFDTSHTADALLRSADNHGQAGELRRGGRHLSAGDPAVRRQGRRRPARARAAARRTRGSRSTPAASASGGSRRCRRRPGRCTGPGSTPRPSGGIARGSTAATGRSLRRVVDQAFCSSWGDDALELLGDLAFQDGQFAEASSAYAQLAPDRPGGPGAGPPRPERRPGPGGGQEAALPGGDRRAPAEPGGAGGVRRRLSRRRRPVRRPPGPAGRPTWPRRSATTTWPRRRRPTADGRPSPARRRGTRSRPARSTSARSSGGPSWSRSRRRGHRRLRAGCGGWAWPRPRRSRPSGSWPTTRSWWATR